MLFSFLYVLRKCWRLELTVVGKFAVKCRFGVVIKEIATPDIGYCWGLKY